MALAVEEGMIRNIANRVVSDGIGAFDVGLGDFQAAGQIIDQVCNGCFLRLFLQEDRLRRDRERERVCVFRDALGLGDWCSRARVLPHHLVWQGTQRAQQLPTRSQQDHNRATCTACATFCGSLCCLRLGLSIQRRVVGRRRQLLVTATVSCHGKFSSL